MKFYRHGCLNFAKIIGMRVKTNGDRIDLVIICHFCRHNNSIVLDKLEVNRCHSNKHPPIYEYKLFDLLSIKEWKHIV